MSAAPALIAAAAGVGFGHAVLPDHRVPLAVVGRANRYPLRKLAPLELTGRGHSHPHGHSHEHPHAHGHGDDHPHHHGHGKPQAPAARMAAVMVPFGAAASPDLTILPVFLAATTAGTGAAIAALIVFAAVTIATIVSLTLFAAAGSYQLEAPWLDRWGNTFTAVVLIAIGALVLFGVI